MVNLKNMSTRFLVTNTVRRVITALGCLLFVFSFIHPFYCVGLTVPGGRTSTYYWSYEYEYHVVADLRGSSSIYQSFSGYWFNPNLTIVPTINWALILLFTVQILTLMFGVAFIVSNGRALSFEPIMSSTAALVLMTYTAQVMSRNFYSNQYQLGYYLVYPSLAMFICAFLLNEVTRKMQATKPAKENKNIIPQFWRKKVWREETKD